MRYRLLDKNGDYTFGSNMNNFISNVDALGQAILTRLWLLKYEWWENLEDGLPLWQDILGARDTAKARNVIVKRIEGTKNVRSVVVTSVIFNAETRSFIFSAVVATDFGTLPLEGVNIG